MKQIYLMLSALIFIFNLSLRSQPAFPENGPVFVDNVVPRVDIFVNPDTLQWLYENVESNIEFHADFIFDNGDIKDTVLDVGFRLRGNTSRYSAKKSFKVSFNTFESGRKFYGLEKMNLNGEHNDPSVIRSKIGWDLLRALEIPAPRANHVELYINNNYYGLYIHVEHIDEEFVKSRFGNNDGNLYKCLWPADLDYIGSNPDLYKFTVGERRAYDLKTNTAEDDYSDLANFIIVLNNSSAGDFRCNFEEVFNIHDYLKVAAVDIFLGNWDGYIYNMNNFYLYHNTATDKFEYIPYDLDNTLGIDWLDRDWGTRNIYDWEKHGDSERKLYTRCMDNPILKDQYSYYMNRLLDEITNVSDFVANIVATRDMIAPYLVNDPFYPLDYGYNMDDFYNSYDIALGAHVDYGIFPYIETRNNSILQQLELNDIKPIVKYVDNSPVFPGNDFWATAYIENVGAISAEIFYSLDDGEPLTQTMFDDGNHYDGETGDFVYGGIIENLDYSEVFKFKILADDNTGNAIYMPCGFIQFELQESEDPEIVVNEFMASNSTTIADEFGEYDDWLEIYNNDEVNIWLGDKYLSDNPDIPDKFLFPDMWLAPGEFVLVWADDDPDQGSLHTNFKLDADGEFIGLYDSEETLFYPLDTMSYGIQNEDISFGRIDDGFEEWIFFTEATPGMSNTSSSIVEDFYQNGIRFYPNPNSTGFLCFNKTIDCRLFDMKGVLIKTATKSNSMELHGLNPGVYIIAFSSNDRRRLIVL